MSKPKLKDVLGTPRTVSVRGVAFPVHGISLDGIATLVQRFPDEVEHLRQQEEVTAEYLVRTLPKIVPAVIAAGLGEPGDDETEEAARTLSFIEQVRMIKVIFEQTAPDGLDPLVEEVKLLLTQFGSGTDLHRGKETEKISSKSSRKRQSN